MRVAFALSLAAPQRQKKIATEAIFFGPDWRSKGSRPEGRCTQAGLLPVSGWTTGPNVTQSATLSPGRHTEVDQAFSMVSTGSLGRVGTATSRKSAVLEMLEGCVRELDAIQNRRSLISIEHLFDNGTT